MKNDTAKFDYFNLTPLIVLLWSLFFLIFIPVMPVASGFGWDGVFYGEVVMGFEDMIGHMDGFHASRIFPAVLFYYVYKVFHLPLDANSIIAGYRVYNIIIIVSAAIFWVIISNRLSLGHIAKWIGFCALFINYPMLNFHYYYPAATDGTAFLFGLIMLYSYLTKRNILLMAITMLSFFCWPVGVMVGFILFIYSNTESFTWYLKEKKNSIFIFILLFSPLLLLMKLNAVSSAKHFIFLLGLEGSLPYKFNEDGFKQEHFTQLLNALISWIYLIFVFRLLLKYFDVSKFITSHFNKKYLIRISISIGVFFVLIIGKRWLYSPDLPEYYSPSRYISLFFKGANVRFPLQFIVSHITYWGPIIILLILYFRTIIEYLQKSELPWILIFLYTVLFSIDTESRHIIYFYPFIVVMILQALDFSEFRNKKIFISLFFLVSFIFSKAWLPIELPGSVFPESIGTGLDSFPMQGFFMNFGLYINAQMYWLHAVCAAVGFALFYVTLRKPAVK